MIKNKSSYAYKEDREEDYDNRNIPIRFLIKDKEVYSFYKIDTWRNYIRLNKLFKTRKTIIFIKISLLNFV
ncbi:plasmid partition family protein [Borreliella finlandensis]|uniref:plasmid partition family protein n=1 Tax=Borreliella finlandensis TaxID=498741 RepID=UPI0009FD2007